MSIPVVGTVVSDPKNFQGFVESIDHPVDMVVAVDITGSRHEAIFCSNPFVKSIKWCGLPGSANPAVAWNLIIKTSMLCRYWVLSRDDVRFGAGLLYELETLMGGESPLGMVHARAGEFGVGVWDLFAIGEDIVQILGLFDENFHNEDFAGADYFFRTSHRPIRKSFSVAAEYTGGSIRTDPVLASRDAGYLESKWSSGWRTCSPNLHPFGNGSFSVSYFPFAPINRA